MNGNMQGGQTANQPLQDKELLLTLLTNQKRVSREYTTATLESNCPAVRQTMRQLAQDTMQMQETLYGLMKQMNLYTAATNASRQEIQNRIQESQKTLAQTQQLMDQARQSIQMQTPNQMPPANQMGGGNQTFMQTGYPTGSQFTQQGQYTSFHNPPQNKQS